MLFSNYKPCHVLPVRFWKVIERLSNLTGSFNMSVLFMKFSLRYSNCPLFIFMYWHSWIWCVYIVWPFWLAMEHFSWIVNTPDLEDVPPVINPVSWYNLDINTRILSRVLVSKPIIFWKHPKLSRSEDSLSSDWSKFIRTRSRCS